MTETLITGSHSRTIAASPDAAFKVLTDLSQLPSWNRRMRSVVETPPTLVPAAEWVVEFRVFGRTWHSRSVLDTFDRSTRRFSYQSATDDGNPSRATWRWDVDDDPVGARVTVRWELRPVTFWRRTLLGRMRAYQLVRQEVPASLDALATRVASTSPGAV